MTPRFLEQTNARLISVLTSHAVSHNPVRCGCYSQYEGKKNEGRRPPDSAGQWWMETPPPKLHLFSHEAGFFSPTQEEDLIKGTHLRGLSNLKILALKSQVQMGKISEHS